MCFRTLAFCGEKYIEVELVELSLLCDLADTLRYLIRHKNHSRQRKVRIARTFPLMLGTLFVGVCPVIDLILDELAAVYCTERCTRQEQVMSRSNWEKALVVGIACFLLLVLLHIEVSVSLVVGIFKQLLGILTPCTEVVLVEDNNIPVIGVYELIFRLDTAVLVSAEQVLERAENNDRLRLISLAVGGVHVDLIVVSVLVGDELPAFKVNMSHKIFMPCGLHRRLECQHQYPLEAHFTAELICGKGLAKAHFSVPQEFRCTVRLISFCLSEILHCTLDGDVLFGTHTEVEGTLSVSDFACSQLSDRRLYVVNRAAVPLVIVLAFIESVKAVSAEYSVNIVVGKARTVGTHSRIRPQDRVRNAACVHYLTDTGFYVTVGVADLYVAIVTGNIIEPESVYGRCCRGALREKFLFDHIIHRLIPLALSLIL